MNHAAYVVAGLVAFAGIAHATDTYDPATRQLTVPTLTIGGLLHPQALVPQGRGR